MVTVTMSSIRVNPDSSPCRMRRWLGRRAAATGSFIATAPHRPVANFARPGSTAGSPWVKRLRSGIANRRDCSPRSVRPCRSSTGAAPCATTKSRRQSAFAEIRLIAETPILTGWTAHPGSPPQIYTEFPGRRTTDFGPFIVVPGDPKLESQSAQFPCAREIVSEACLRGQPCSCQGLRVATALGLDPAREPGSRWRPGDQALVDGECCG